LHAEREEAARTAAWLAQQLAARGIEVCALGPDAARVASPDVVAVQQFPDDLDLVFVLGGDGTLLRAADSIGPDGPPLLGVNFGHLGFLSELERADLESGLARVLEGFTIEERMMLEGEIVSGGERTRVRALNDVIVAKVSIGRAIRVAVSVGGEPFGSWIADGLIVATSTGSTAYSFSAGGPIVSPRIDCLVVTPVAPHGLFDRSFIVPPDEEVVVHVLPDPDAASLSADGGAALPMPAGSEVHLRAAAGRVRLAKLAPAPFWRLVYEKVFFPKGSG
jgi:NAD+ kinase